MEALRIVQKMVWGPWLLGLFLAVGVLCMVRLRGFPIRHIRVWWGETVVLLWVGVMMAIWKLMEKSSGSF